MSMCLGSEIDRSRLSSTCVCGSMSLLGEWNMSERCVFVCVCVCVCVCMCTCVCVCEKEGLDGGVCVSVTYPDPGGGL